MFVSIEGFDAFLESLNHILLVKIAKKKTCYFILLLKPAFSMQATSCRIGVFTCTLQCRMANTQWYVNKSKTSGKLCDNNGPQ